MPILLSRLTVTSTADGTIVTASTGSDASTSLTGYALAVATIAPNMTVWNDAAPGTLKAETATTPKELTLNIIRQYHPMNLTYTMPSTGDADIVVDTDALTGATMTWATDVDGTPATEVRAGLEGCTRPH